MANSNPEYAARGLDRIINFSDGIIAVAMTLMVVNIHLPDSVSLPQLRQGLVDLVPVFQDYIVSFVVVSIYWVEHHRTFKSIRRCDSGLMWLNLLFLLLVVLVPFTTNLIDRFGDRDPMVIVIYAGSLALTGLTLVAIWLYATHNCRLVDVEPKPAQIREELVSRLVSPVVFLLSIPVAFISPSLATFVWLALLPLSLMRHVALEREFARSPQALE